MTSFYMLRTHRIPLLFLSVTAVLFMAHVLFPAEGLALGSHDIYGLFYPWLELLHNRIWASQSIFWDSTRFAGYPFLSNPQIAFFYPPTWLAIIFPVRVGISLYLLLHLWLSGVGMYFFITKEQPTRHYEQANRKDVRWLDSLHQNMPALVAAVCFMFSGFYTSRMLVGHIGLIATHTWVPWLLFATSIALRRRTWQTAVLAGLPFGLAILAGHTTSLIYISLIWGLYALYFLTVSDARFTHWARLGQIIKTLGIASVTALLVSSVQLLPLLQFVGRAGRTADTDFDFATIASFPPSHLITLLIPTFFGEPTYMGYWSVPNFQELTAYIGILPLLAIVFAITQKQNRIRWFYLALIALGILLALGSYGFLYRLFYDWIPPFRLTRAPGRAMFLYVFAGSALLGHMLADWQARQPSYAKLSRLLLSGGVITGVVALAAVGASFAAIHPTDDSGRLWHQIGGWATATAVWGAACFLLSQRPHRLISLALLLLMVSDLWLFGYKFLQLESISPPTYWQTTVDILRETEEDTNGRILPWGISIFDQNGAGQVGLNSLFGYNALEVGTITALTNSIPDPRASSFDILSAEYMLSNLEAPQFTEGEAGLQLLGNGSNVTLYRRPNALPQTRLVTRAEAIPDQQAAISRLHQPDFDPRTTAITGTDVSCTLGGEAGTADIVEQYDGYWHIRTEATEPSLLIVSESDYPGWTVTVNGEEALWHTAYTAVRAVCVPAGTADVIWRFRPTIFMWGGLVSLLGLAVVFLAKKSETGS